MIARFGGDEFAVLCAGIADEAHALRMAERLVRAFAEPFEVSASRASARASVGVVVSDPRARRAERAALRRRRRAVPRQGARTRAPRGLRRGMRGRVAARLRIEDDLRRALEAGDQLWVAYQPFYRLAGRDLRGRGAAALDPPRARARSRRPSSSRSPRTPG